MKKILMSIVGLSLWGNVMFGQNCAPTSSFSGAGASAFTLNDPNGAFGGTITNTNGIQLNAVAGARECRGFVNVGAINDVKFAAECTVSLTAGSSPGHIPMAFSSGNLDPIQSGVCPDQTAAQNCVYANTNQNSIAIYILSNNGDITQSGTSIVVWTKLGANNQVQGSAKTINIPAAAIGNFIIRFERTSATTGKLVCTNGTTNVGIDSTCVTIPAILTGLNTLHTGVQTSSSSARNLTGKFDNFRIYNGCNLNTFDAPVANPVTICAGNTASLTAATTKVANPIFTWYKNINDVVPVFTGATFVTPALTATTTYYVSYSENCGKESKRTAVTVTVNPNPVAPIVAATTICSGNTATLTVSPITAGNTYSWFNVANGGTALATGTTYTTPVLTAGATYYVSSSNSCGQTARTAVTITVNPLPVKPVVAATSICPGNTATLTVSPITAGNTYSWFNVATGGTALATGTSYTTPTLNAGTTYYVSSSNSCGQTARTAVTVTINPLPVAPTISTASICSGNGATLTVAPITAGNTYSWFNVATGGTALATGTTYTTAALNAGTFTYYVSSSNACGQTVRTAVTVNVTQTPVVAAITGKDAVCKDQIIELESITTGGVWSSSNTAIATVKQTGVVKGISAGTTTISYTVTNGICPTKVTKVITVNDVVSFVITGPSPLCAGTSGNSFSVSPAVAGADYTWNIQDGADIGVNFPVNGSTSCRLSIPGNPAETQFTLRCQGLNACGASPMVTKLITLNAAVPKPNVTCSGTSGTNTCVNLSVTNNAGYTISWKVDGVEIGTGTSVVRPIGKTVFCYYTSPAGCTSYGYYTPTSICTSQKKADAVEVLEDPQFMVYPNPTEGMLNFTTDGYSGHAVIMNLLGEVVEDISIEASKTLYQVSMENKAQGTYIIKFTGGDKDHVSMFVVE